METLANKYRPTTLEDVVEQPAVIEILKNQIKKNLVKNCYLFTGPAGVGKTSIGRILAKSLNSEIPPIEIDAASNNSIEDIRKLINECQVKPLAGYYKTFILDEVHVLSNSAWQGLLKLIEEPPKNVVIILCTTEPQKIPNTILSRVQRFDLKRISVIGIEERLTKILNQETITTPIQWDKDAVNYIAKLSNGGMRSALSLLDKCLSFSSTLSIQNIAQIIGETNIEDLIDLTNRIINKNESGILLLIDKLFNNGVDLKYFVKNYTEFLLDVNKYLLLCSMEYLQIPEYYQSQIDSLVKNNDGNKIKELFGKIITLSENLKWATDPKSYLEMKLLLLCR